MVFLQDERRLLQILSCAIKICPDVSVAQLRALRAKYNQLRGQSGTQTPVNFHVQA